jgi:hypothetical protein
MLNMLQFNSKQGSCPICYIIPTGVKVESQKVKGSERTKQVFIFKKNFHIRTNEQFQQFYNSKTNEISEHGVKKGKPFLNYFINFPEQVLLDYMHVCVRGPQERLLDIWFDTENRQKPYYLGK